MFNRENLDGSPSWNSQKEEALVAYNKAIAEYEKALETDPDNPLLCSKMGDALFRSGEKEEALAACDQAIEINPKNDRAKDGKKYILSNIGMRPVTL